MHRPKNLTSAVRLGTLAIAAVILPLLSGCKANEYVSATIAPTQGNTANGEVRFYKTKEGVRVLARVRGLTPGAHGFHLHEKGDCSAPDASSAGGHYNPAGSPHGSPNAESANRHAGDLGNIEAGPDGKGSVDFVDHVLVYENLVGLAVLVHANADDFSSQPAGNAGPRVGCGVIAGHEPTGR